jgi:hypothetical protein
MPGGEVYFCPVEDATEGVVDFSEFPAFQEPDEIEGVRMVYRAGRVVEASATRGEDILFETLDRDEGARVLGELGIGCNPGISATCGTPCSTRRSTAPVHLAIGAAFPSLGGKNESVVHWDMVKDLPPGRATPVRRRSRPGERALAVLTRGGRLAIGAGGGSQWTVHPNCPKPTWQPQQDCDVSSPGPVASDKNAASPRVP